MLDEAIERYDMMGMVGIMGEPVTMAERLNMTETATCYDPDDSGNSHLRTTELTCSVGRGGV